MVKYSTIENGWWSFIIFNFSNKLKEVYDLVHEMVHSAISSQNLSQHVEWITEYIVGHHSWDHCSGHEYRMVDDKVLEKKVNGLAFMDEERCTLKDAIITTIEVRFLVGPLNICLTKYLEIAVSRSRNSKMVYMYTSNQASACRCE